MDGPTVGYTASTRAEDVKFSYSPYEHRATCVTVLFTLISGPSASPFGVPEGCDSTWGSLMEPDDHG